MKYLLAVLCAVMLFTMCAQAQHPEMKFKQSLIGAKSGWDSTYLLVPYSGLYLTIENTSDTLRYFFGASKADSGTSINYKIFGADYDEWYVPNAGASFKCIFMKHLGADSTAVYLRRFPYGDGR